MHHKKKHTPAHKRKLKMDRKRGNVKKLGWSPAGRVFQSYKTIHRFNYQIKELME